MEQMGKVVDCFEEKIPVYHHDDRNTRTNIIVTRDSTIGIVKFSLVPKLVMLVNGYA